MPTIHTCPIPEEALLRRYTEPSDPRYAGAYTDCFTTRIEGQPGFDAYVLAFYTTSLFRLERVILGAFARRPSTDAQAQALASGSGEAFAAWRVEARDAEQLLLCDVSGRTRSWLMVRRDTNADATDLYFGSAVVPAPNTPGDLGAVMRFALPAHRLYSRRLLSAARSRLAAARDVQ